MGNDQATLGKMERYKEPDAIKDPTMTLGQKMYFKQDIPDMILLEKELKYSDFGLDSDSKVASLEKRMRSVSRSIFPVKCIERSKVMAKCLFSSGSMNLNDFVLYQREKGNDKVPEAEVRHLLNFLTKAGEELESVNEYNFLLNMSNVFITNEGLKVQNPFTYKYYISESSKIYETTEWMSSGGVPTDEYRVKSIQNHQEYLNKVRQSVIEMGLVVLFTSNLRQDTNILEENKKPNPLIVDAALATFKDNYPNDLHATVKNLIYPQTMTQAAIFSVLPKFPLKTSTYFVAPIDYSDNFASKMLGQGGFFYRDYDRKPNPSTIMNLRQALAGQPIRQSIHNTSLLQPGQDPGQLEQSLREERYNPYVKRTPSKSPEPSRAAPVNDKPSAPTQPSVSPPNQGSQVQRPPTTTQSNLLNPTVSAPPAGPQTQSNLPIGTKEDEVYGRLEMLFRERRTKEDVNKSLAEIANNRSSVRNDSLQHGFSQDGGIYPSGRLEKDPKQFNFPSLNVGYTDPTGKYQQPTSASNFLEVPGRESLPKDPRLQQGSGFGYVPTSGGFSTTGSAVPPLNIPKQPASNFDSTFNPGVGRENYSSTPRNVDYGRPAAFQPDLNLLEKIKNGKLEGSLQQPENVYVVPGLRPGPSSIRVRNDQYERTLGPDAFVPPIERLDPISNSPRPDSQGRFDTQPRPENQPRPEFPSRTDPQAPKESILSQYYSKDIAQPKADPNSPPPNPPIITNNPNSSGSLFYYTPSPNSRQRLPQPDPTTARTDNSNFSPQPPNYSNIYQPQFGNNEGTGISSQPEYVPPSQRQEQPSPYRNPFQEPKPVPPREITTNQNFKPNQGGPETQTGNRVPYLQPNQSTPPQLVPADPSKRPALPDQQFARQGYQPAGNQQPQQIPNFQNPMNTTQQNPNLPFNQQYPSNSGFPNNPLIPGPQSSPSGGQPAQNTYPNPPVIQNPPLIPPGPPAYQNPPTISNPPTIPTFPYQSNLTDKQREQMARRKQEEDLLRYMDQLRDDVLHDQSPTISSISANTASLKKPYYNPIPMYNTQPAYKPIRSIEQDEIKRKSPLDQFELRRDISKNVENYNSYEQQRIKRIRNPADTFVSSDLSYPIEPASLQGRSQQQPATVLQYDNASRPSSSGAGLLKNFALKPIQQ